LWGKKTEKEQVVSWIEEETLVCANENDFEMVARHHHSFLSKGKGKEHSFFASLV
jgi:hypothetical protein